MNSRSVPTRVKLAMRFTPERIAALLSVAVVGFALVVIATRPSGGSDGGVTGSSAPIPSSSLPTAAPTPTGTAAASASTTSPPSTEPSAVPPATPVPARWATPAATLIATETDLIEARDALADAAAEPGTSASDLAAAIRGMNTRLTTALALIDGMARAGAPPELAADVEGLHAAALATNLRTLEASLQDQAAYAAGARRVVQDLEDLEAAAARIAEAAGLPPP